MHWIVGNDALNWATLDPFSDVGLKRFIPFAIIAAVLIVALGAGARFFRSENRKTVGVPSAAGKPGAVPAHLRGQADAPAVIEEFGDFECLPCFILWPALRNLEKDYGARLAVKFRQCPLPQHPDAALAARASEAAGLQNHFWEMHDVLYLSRGQWTHGGDIHAVFSRFAARIGIDEARFEKDIEGEEVAKRLAADHDRAASLGIDRTPVLFLNGQRLRLQDNVEDGIRADIESTLAGKIR